MTRLILATAVGALAAGVAAWQIGGTIGNGVLLGYLLGAAMSGLGGLYQRHVLRTAPRLAFQAMGLSFGTKLAAMVVFAVVFRYVEPCARRADWRGFLIAFAFAVVVVLPFAALDAVRGAPRAPGRSLDSLDPGRTA